MNLHAFSQTRPPESLSSLITPFCLPGQDYQLDSGPLEKPKSSSSRSKGKDRETGRDRDRDRGKGKGKGKHLYHNDKGSHRAAQGTQATSSHVQAESDHLESSGQGGCQ